MAGNGKTFIYDSENRLVSMNAGAVTLKYDGDGKRVAKTVSGVTTQFLVDDNNPTGYPQVAEELVGGVVQRAYAYGIRRIDERQLINSQWASSFYGYDGAGNVRQLTDSSGLVTDSYDYDSFGNTLRISGTTPNAYLYRGEQYDSDLGLYYLRARYYNSLTGRFLTRDPEGGWATDPKTLHKYLYADGDPVNGSDPTGRDDEIEYNVTLICGGSLYCGPSGTQVVAGTLVVSVLGRYIAGIVGFISEEIEHLIPEPPHNPGEREPTDPTPPIRSSPPVGPKPPPPPPEPEPEPLPID